MIGAAELNRWVGLPPPTTEQVAVIEAPLSPALVVAGAGSGKTETMAGRVLYLVANGLVRPEQVLGLTFTRKAAAGLGARIRTRLRGLAARLDRIDLAAIETSDTAVFAVPVLADVPELAASVGATERGAFDLAPTDRVRADWSPPGSDPTHLDWGEPEVWTYHAFGGRLIAEFGPLLGIEPQGRVLTQTGAWQLARRVVTRWDGDLDTLMRPDQVTEQVLAVAGGLADHLSGPQALSDSVELVLQAIREAPASPRQRQPLRASLKEHQRRLADRQAVLPLVEAFEQAKRAAGVVDFADQMQVAARLATELAAVGRAVRDRYRVVLLDEYQDTGHAQRIILRALFGSAGGSVTGHPVTAVGDPVQTIYSWRGASASNLPRFVTDFPAGEKRPALVLPLSTSFRNASVVLEVANAVSAPLRSAAVPVRSLRARDGAPTGEIKVALLMTEAEEQEWVADEIAARWLDACDRTGSPPTAAVLLRRRRDMDAFAVALRARGLPVEIVGLGGLLVEPEIADLVALLRVLVDPTAGSSMLRLLTGARWRIGAADLAALHRRATVLAGRPAAGGRAATGAESVRDALGRAAVVDDNETASLVDAVADPGDPDGYSAIGYRRLTGLGEELRRLRGRLAQPLPDLISDLERSTGLDIEVAVHSPAGRAHLNAFADVVSGLADTGAGPDELIDYLLTASEREDGLAPGEVPQVSDRVQVLTVHAAKGLEWDTVAVPQVCRTLFPSERFRSWLTDPGQLPPAVRGDAGDLPSLTLPGAGDQSDLERALTQHAEELKDLQQVEERRLMYVALTRAENTVLLSGHHWGRTAAKPYGPSAFLTEIVALRPVPEGLSIPQWAHPPADGAVNPLTSSPVTVLWPVDPLGSRRQAIQDGASLVETARRERRDHFAHSAGGRIDGPVSPTPAGGSDPDPDPDPDEWARDLRVLLAERDRVRSPVFEQNLPRSLSVSGLVELARDPAALARRLRRPIPTAPSPSSARGTAFHSWLEQRFRGEPLLDVADLPGAADGRVRPPGGGDAQDELRAAFLASSWAERFPLEVEVPFQMVIGGTPVRGRIDAVFGDPDGGVTVVDWKTGPPPSGAALSAVAVQLAIYRLAAADLLGIRVEGVRAAFVHILHGVTLAPSDLLDSAGLAALIERATGVGMAPSVT